MKRWYWFVILITTFVILVFPSIAYAHPGRTAADGCHYCRTNCAKWGEVEGARHCHGGGSAVPQAASPKVYSPPTEAVSPSCPVNSSYDSSQQRCVCKEGYTASLNGSYCIKIPDNAHSSNNGTDAWECNSGYKEAGNTCVLIEEEVIEQEVIIEPEINLTEVETEDANYEPSTIEETTFEIPQADTPAESTNSNDVDEETDLTATDTAIALATLGGMGYGLWWGIKKVVSFVKGKI